MTKKKLKFSHLYKFREVNTLSLTNLANATLWFAKINSFNDPYEGCFDLEKAKKILTFNDCIDVAKLALSKHKPNIDIKTRDDLITGEIVSLGQEEFEKKYKGYMADVLEDTLNMMKEDYGFLSLSSDVAKEDDIFVYEDSNIANLHMWSLYADGLRGFCVRFNAQKLFKSLQKNHTDKYFHGTPVRYDNNPPFPSLCSEKTSIYINDSSTIFDIDSILNILNSKHSTFENEVEFRFISSSKGLKSYSPDCVEEIYIGEKMPKDQVKLLMLIIKQVYPNIKVTKVERHPYHYGVIPSEMDLSEY